MSFTINMENIAGFRGKVSFELQKGLNVVEAPNAGGKTSFIRGIRAMILPADTLKDSRHFLNITTKSGNIHLKLDNDKYSRDMHDVNGRLSVSGKPITDEGIKADTLCVAIRENVLLNLIDTGKSVKSVLEEFSEAKYYRLGTTNYCKKKIQELNIEISRQNEEYQALKEYQKQLTELLKKREKLIKEMESLPEIPQADSKTMLANQKLLQEKTKELTEARITLDTKKKEIDEREKGINRKEEEIKEYKKRIEEFKQKHPNIDNEIAKIERTIRDLVTDRNEHYAKISSISGELEATRKAQIETSKSKANYCPACGGKLTPEQLRKREKDLQIKYDKLTKEMGLTNEQIEAKEIEHETLQEEIQKVKVGRTGDVKMLDDSQRRLKDLKREYDNLAKEKEKLEGRIIEISKEINNIEKSIDPSIIDLIRKHSNIDTQLGVIESDIKRTKGAIESRGETGEKVQELDKRKRLLTAVASFMQKEAERVLMEVVNDFNTKTKEIYDLLEFKDFEKIYIDDYTFEVNVIRKKGGQTIRQPINSLSGSERGSIGLILMLAGKEKYLSDFPMFVLDAVTEDYDATRLSRIVKYLEGKVPYVIVTTLSPHVKRDEIVIKHRLGRYLSGGHE
ncbi:MAG: AAA family ATPase [Nanoarchaeota archaeon]|nr:AAA family ATPase [Nanoarchaeota archaeon]MCG2718593.1 hypothetical protein [Nanoarchaeota archaeon]